MMAAAYIALAAVSAAMAGVIARAGAGYRKEGRIDRALGCGVFGATAAAVAVMCVVEVVA